MLQLQTGLPGRDRLPPRLWDGYFKFCVERNPSGKTLSFFYI
jgi:hypothetical protein